VRERLQPAHTAFGDRLLHVIVREGVVLAAGVFAVEHPV
jgi:hypothetical protein